MDFVKMDFTTVEVRCLAARLPKDKVKPTFSRVSGKLRPVLKAISFNILYGFTEGERE